MMLHTYTKQRVLTKYQLPIAYGFRDIAWILQVKVTLPLLRYSLDFTDQGHYGMVKGQIKVTS